MLRRRRKLPLRTHPREVMVKPVGARPRQEVQKCQENRSGEDDFAASHEVHKLFDYVKTVQAASGVPRLYKQLQFTCACTARTSTTAEDVERS